MSTPPAAAHRVKLANEARQRFVTETSGVMAELGAAVQERFRNLVNEPAPLPQAQSRRDAWTLYQRQESVWVKGTLKAWQAALTPVAIAAKQPSPENFELMGTDVIENRIVASRMVVLLMDQISSQWEDLMVRIKSLEGPQEQPGQDILRPDALVLLLVEQWAQAGMSTEAWFMASEPIHALLAPRLAQAYTHVNAFLIQHGVLPTIELSDRIKLAPPAPRRTPAPTGAPADAAPRSGSGFAPGAGAGSGFGSAGDETRMMTTATPLARTRTRAQSMLGQIKRLLMGSGLTDFEVTRHQPPSPALAAAIAVRSKPASIHSDGGTILESYSPAGVAQVASDLRQRTSDLKEKAETKNEKATIEIVALMFQSILQEDRIPPGIRVWFARLQMPVLRVALAEPDFFGTLNHPARQLIDRMGSCVMGFDDSGIHGSSLEAEIKRIVQVIEQYPETGRRVYQLVYTEFQKFLAQFLTGKVATQKLVSVAQQVEEKETLTIQYTIEMRNMLKDIQVRDEIREFLFKIWAEVLAVAAVRKGPQHLETLGFKKVASDLVWTASAKPKRSDRARVIAELPHLLQQLRAGMSLLGVAPSEQEAHLKVISDTLADAFLSKSQAIPAEQIQAMAQRLEYLEDFVNDDGLVDLPLDAQSIELMLGMDPSTIDVVADGGSKPTAAMLAWAQELELGSWFTLDHNGQVSNVQFVWRSNRKHLNLFASTEGHSYLIQAGRLAAYLQAGLLLPQEEDTLTVRATRDALAKLEANPERLLG